MHADYSAERAGAASAPGPCAPDLAVAACASDSAVAAATQTFAAAACAPAAPAVVLPAQGWSARLELGYQRRDARTVLSHRLHTGPLRVQKALYPEGDAVCHTILLHPPAGIAAGDVLTVSVDIGPQAHALLTTPGATKWYRSEGARARQSLELRVGRDAAAEWLPQETILFDGVIGRQDLHVDLAPGARFLGFECLCLGRRAAGERYTQGQFRVGSRIDQGGLPLWREWGTLRGGADSLCGPTGFAGHPVCATVIAAGMPDAPALVHALRAQLPPGEWAFTALPGVMLGRWLGPGGEAARTGFIAIWRVLRPTLFGLPASIPRIWNT